MKRLVIYEIENCGQCQYTDLNKAVCYMTGKIVDLEIIDKDCPLPIVKSEDCSDCSMRLKCVNSKDNKRCMGYSGEKG